MSEPAELAEVFKKEFMERNKPCAADECQIQELIKISSDVFHPIKKWKFKFVDTTQVIKAINSLKNSNMAGPDQIQAQFLKAVKYQVAPILTQLTNMMIASQCYPATLVEGRTIPVYKGKSKAKNNVSSFREVTTVSVLGKVVEKILAAQINENIEATLPINIFGYRPKKATSKAVE